MMDNGRWMDSHPMLETPGRPGDAWKASLGLGMSPQVSREGGRREALVDTGSLGLHLLGEEPSPLGGLGQACHGSPAERGWSRVDPAWREHLLRGHVDQCSNAWRWLLQSHFISGVVIGRGVGVQYNFSHPDVSVSLTSHLHSRAAFPSHYTIFTKGTFCT